MKTTSTQMEKRNITYIVAINLMCRQMKKMHGTIHPTLICLH